MKKTVCIILMLLLVLSLPACGNTDVPKATTDAPVITVSPADNSSEQSSFPVSVPTDCVFNPAQFDGKLQSCAYAGDGKLLVTADKLYLYDTVTSSVLAVTEAPLRDFDVQIMEGSYMLSGMGDDGMIAYIYDHSLKQAYEIPVNELLMEDFVISETGIAASTDGKKLAIAAMRGLYLYDLESESLTTLLDLTQNIGIASVGISMIHGLAFTQDNSQLVFYGSGLSIPAVNDEDSFSVYGSIALDGSNLQLAKSFDYDIEEMQSRTDRLFFPQTFTQNNGSLFWIDRKTGNEATLFYSSESEGSNGVYSSEQGKYVATAVLAGNLTVRVYDMDSGELIATQVIENSDSTYFNRIPRIYLLDEARTAVVLLGGSITEIDTLVSTFAFGE